MPGGFLLFDPRHLLCYNGAMSENVINIKEACEITGNSLDCISNHCRKGTFNAHKIGHEWVIDKISFLRAVEEKKIGKPINIPDFSNKEPVRCETCGKEFRSPQALVRHQNTVCQRTSDAPIVQRYKQEPVEPEQVVRPVLQTKPKLEAPPRPTEPPPPQPYNDQHEEKDELGYSAEDLRNAIFIHLTRYEKNFDKVLERLKRIEQKARMFQRERLMDE
jgi:hypothetical protein